MFLVNRSGAEIFGRRSYRSVAELPEPPEFAAITVPRSAFAEAVNDALEAGVKAIVGMTAGFGETGAEGAALQAQIVARVRAAGGVLLGPNCMGVHDSTVGFECLAWADPPAGTVGIISQSGSMIMDFARRVQAYGLGISRAASIGNQADVTIADLVAAFADHAPTTAIAIYCEDVRNGRSLFRAIERAVAAGTPVVILTPAATAAARRAAGSHTGALLSDDTVVDAACRASGAVLVHSIRELAEAVHAVNTPLRATGRRAAVASDAGGLAVLGGAAVSVAGLEVPEFSDALEAKLATTSMPGAGLRNPVDIVGMATIDEFLPVIDTVLRSGEVDCMLGNIAIFDADTPEAGAQLGARIASVAVETGRPLAIATSDLNNRGVEAMRAGGVPVFGDIESAAHALAILCRDRPTGVPLVTDATELLPEAATTYFGARDLLSASGIAFAAAEQVTDVTEAIAAAERIGFPVVLKALGNLHKSDSGGVVLGLSDVAALRDAFAEMRDRLTPPSFSVEEMVAHDDATEVTIGGRNDPRFGPIVLIGAGGVFTEVFADTAVALAPIDATHAEHLVRGLRVAPLLLGARGRPNADLTGVGEIVAAVSELLARYPEISELDINPVLATPLTTIAVDVRIIRTA